MTTKSPLKCSRSVYDRIYEISEKNFWGAVRPIKGRTGSEHLGRAVRCGLSGRKAAAYRALADYHRVALASEWAAVTEKTAKAKKPGQKLLRDLYSHRINVWHTLVIDFGKEIDWSRTHLGKPIPGSNYFGWLSPAVTQAVQTGDERSRDFLAETVLSYHRGKNRVPGVGALNIGGCSVFNRLASRAKINVLMPGYLAMLNTGDVAPQVVEAFMKILIACARACHIRLNWEALRPHEDHRGNHSIVAAAALFRMAKLFPEFKESRAWERRASERFLYFVENSFYADGGYCERVWGYGTMALFEMVNAYVTAREYGGFGENDRKILNGLRKAFRWYAATMGPLERMPTFGDGETAPRINRNVLDNARKIFPESTDRYLGVDRTKSCLLKPSGFAIMRNGDESASTYINISFARNQNWHEHYDQLSMNLWSMNEPVIQELDRWGPYHSPLDIMVRAPEAHNLFLIDGMVYDNRREDAHDVHWLSNDAVDCFTACHRAYRYEVFEFKGHGCFNINGVVRRTVVFVKDPGYALVVDSVWDENHADFNRAVSQYWHSPFQFKVLGSGLVRTKGAKACLLAFARTDGLRRLECTTDFAGEAVEHSCPHPDRYTLRARRWGRVEEDGKPGFATVLYPFKGKTPGVSIRPVPTQNGAPYRAEGYEIRTPRGKDLILLNPELREGVRCGGRKVTGFGSIILGNGRGRVMWK